MMSDIQAGDGWRLLGPDEVVREGDEFINFGEWQPVFKLMIGEETTGQVRRRIPAKPNVLDIQSEGGSISLETIPRGPVWLIQRWEDSRDEVRLDTTEQIRQVIAWLQQVAEWREAQESVAKTPPN